LTRYVKDFVAKSHSLVYSKDAVMEELLKRYPMDVLKELTTYIIAASSVAYVAKFTAFIDTTVTVYDRKHENVSRVGCEEAIYDAITQQCNDQEVSQTLFAKYVALIDDRIDRMMNEASERRQSSMLDEDSEDMMDAELETDAGRVARIGMAGCSTSDWQHEC